MDYTQAFGTKLFKHQWDLIRFPEMLIGVFEKDEAGAAQSIENPFEQFIKTKIAELSKTGNKYFTIIHCDECNVNSSSTLSSYTFSDLIDVPPNYVAFENNPIRVSNIESRVAKIQFAQNDKGKCLIVYYSYSGDQQIGFSSSGDTPSEISKVLLFFDGSGTQSDCTPLLGNWSQSICSLTPANIFSTETATITYYNNIFSTILSCLPGQTGNSSFTDLQIGDLLRDMRSQARFNQHVEFLQKGTLYTLSDQGQIVKSTTFSADEEINAGIWNEAVDMKMRLAYDQQGFLQFTALGIKRDIQIAASKTASSVEIALNMRLRNNAFFKKHQVKDAKLSPSKIGVSLDSDQFPDGQKVVIAQDASFFKLLCEAGGVGLTFLKTAKIEQPVYKTAEASVIKVPPLATGTLESAGMVVTDITSAVTMIHDLTVDDEARSNAIKGLTDIKTQISDDPSLLFPILTEVVVEEFTGSTPDEFSEANASTTDEGRRQHIVVKTSVRTVSSVFSSGKVIVKLPEMAKNIAFKMARSKSFLKFKRLPEIDAEKLKVFESKLKNLPDGGEKFLDDFKDVSDDVRREVVNDPDLIDNWKELDEDGFDKSIKTNIESLKNPDTAREAVEQSGKSKPTWPEIQALFKRGNDFNAKGRAKYGDDFVEVVLKGVDGRAGKRLDTYLPPSNGNPGQIISRKATTLSEIQPSTFRNYLNELITKYPKGAELNSSKFTPGTILEGDYKLEIPRSNQSFFEASTEFRNILNDFNKSKGVSIEIIYLVE